MSNMLDYLDWRGDLSFTDAPFNEVDNLLLAGISYVEFDDVVPGFGQGSVRLKDASDTVFREKTDYLAGDRSFVSFAPYVLQRMAKTERFKDVRIKNYVNRINLAEELQFSSMEFVLPDGTSYVAFRGTDDTIVGWKEDFNMSYQIVPADRYAANYLNALLHIEGVGRPEKVRVGGHSKGGHLAVYASSCVPQKDRKRILSVYCNDGPGFQSDFLETEKYRGIREKIVSIMPDAAIVGVLLNSDVDAKVIKSSGKGPMQHNPTTWQVLGNSFVKADGLAQGSKIFRESFSKWMGEISNDERKAFVDELFGIVESTGVTTLSELQESFGTYAWMMFRNTESLSPVTKKAAEEFLRCVFYQVKETTTANRKIGSAMPGSILSGSTITGPTLPGSVQPGPKAFFAEKQNEKQSETGDKQKSEEQ